MPTLDQVAPASQALSGADEILISQLAGGVWVTRKSNVAALLSLLAASGLQPTGFMSSQGAPTSNVGVDGWTYLDANTGDVFEKASGTWTKTGNIKGPQGTQGNPQPGFSVAALTLVNSIGANDLMAISQNGTTVAVPYATVLSAETIDQLNPANSAADTDTFFAGQGSNVMVRQTLSAVWTLIASHLPTWHRPVIELTTNTTLDGSVHNNALLICSKPITVSAAMTMSSGFTCDTINVSGGEVTFGSTILTSNAGNALSTGESARISAANYSGGMLYFAALSSGSGGLPPNPPGQVSSLASSATTYSSVTLSWISPSSGGQVTSYAVTYRPHGSGSFVAAPCSPGTASTTSFTVTGLTSAAAYDFQVIAQNSAGAGTPVELDNITTANSTSAPGQPTNVNAGNATSSSMTIAWSAPSSGGAVSGYSVYDRQTGVSSWTLTTSSLGSGATSYVVTGLSANTSYDFYVAANSVSSGSTSSSTVTASTSASSAYLLTLAGTQGNNLQPGASLAHGQGGIICQININTSPADGSHTAPETVWFAWGPNTTTIPTTGLISTIPYSPDGIHNLIVQYISAPASAGTYYLWAIAEDSGSNVVDTFVWPAAFTIT